jgi:hypothetical protein
MQIQAQLYWQLLLVHYVLPVHKLTRYLRLLLRLIPSKNLGRLHFLFATLYIPAEQKL